VARLTDEQRECLREALPTPCADADWSLTDTDGNELDSGSITSGGSQVIVAPDATLKLNNSLITYPILSGELYNMLVRLNGQVPQTFSYTPSTKTLNVISPPCADATVELNGVEMATIASGDTENIEVRQSSGSTLVGSQQSQHWRIGDSDIEINGTQVASVKAEDGLDIPVIQDGSPVGSWNGTQWIVPSCPAGATVTLEVSDSTPNVGATITLTATAVGITATNYLFFARKGSDLFLLSEQAGNVFNWTVDIFGTFTLFVQADDTSVGSFNVGGNSVTSSGIIINGLQFAHNGFIEPIVGTTYPDFSPFNRDGILVNSPTVVAGAGGYVEFNGVNQYVDNIGTTADFSFIQNTLQFTVGMWVYIPNLSLRNFFAGNTLTSGQKGFSVALDSANYGPPIGVVTKRLMFSMYRGVSGISNVLFVMSNDNAITAVGWNYIALTMNGLGTAQWYLNGAAISTTETGTYVLPTGNSTRELTIGRVNGFSLYFDGRVGPNHIYNVELSAAEILNNFNADKTQYGF